MSRSAHKGFTLIELLVVIAIIGLLSSVVMASLNTARAKARDTSRITALRQVETALALYHLDNNAYPSTGGGWYGSSANCYGSAHGDAAIPGLAPTYIANVPVETHFDGSTGACFLYNSNGVGYKFIAHGTMETCTAGSCPLQDPLRSNQKTSGVYTPDYASI